MQPELYFRPASYLILIMNCAVTEKISIISKSQYGFITGFCAHSLLDDFSEELYTTFERNQFTCALFLHMAKAFDSLNHKVLLSELYYYGSGGSFSFSLLPSFLTNSFQEVS